MQSASSDRTAQQGRWLLWQMGSVQVEEAGPVHREPPSPPVMPMAADFGRHHYEAVISRMKQAGQRTGVYTSWA